jgi:hypothetical protein
LGFIDGCELEIDQKAVERSSPAEGLSCFIAISGCFEMASDGCVVSFSAAHSNRNDVTPTRDANNSSPQLTMRKIEPM